MSGTSPKTWSTREAYLLGMVCLFVGLVGGYLIRGSSSPETSPPPPPAPAATSSTESAPSAASLSLEAQPLLDALKANPKDVPTLVKLGNVYYDHKAWSDAIRYYQHALDLRPGDPDVRTDMGTAYFYSGFPDKAIEQFNQVLKASPNYPNTLFNLGIVRRDAYQDKAGALAAWEKILKNNPNLPPDQVQKVQSAIADIKAGKG
ncbi:MAG: tetratricopeptide repeat protein [Terriglobales bacterium]